ncbi:hypothetical protein [Phormidesmis priestleyi]|uniref:hypothetical protein n=1 Tax=Phormidesmis priestleyi TaxID=268141 RepID=UPI00083AC6B0|nr:hypothetical protein [Phormidesmis priestleyi]
MIHGLLWLPLLAAFIGLAWAGRNEYQKIEAYRVWAETFQRAKYDVYAVLGQEGNLLTWGKPTRKEPVNVQTFSLKDVREIHLLVDGQTADLRSPPSKGKSIGLQFILDRDGSIEIPFTQTDLAAKWGQALTEDLQKLRSESRL